MYFIKEKKEREKRKKKEKQKEKQKCFSVFILSYLVLPYFIFIEKRRKSSCYRKAT